jgi:hypothetical protein
MRFRIYLSHLRSLDAQLCQQTVILLVAQQYWRVLLDK